MPVKRRRPKDRRLNLRMEDLTDCERHFIQDAVTEADWARGDVSLYALFYGTIAASPQELQQRVIELWRMRDAERAKRDEAPAERPRDWPIREEI